MKKFDGLARPNVMDQDHLTLGGVGLADFLVKLSTYRIMVDATTKLPGNHVLVVAGPGERYELTDRQVVDIVPFGYVAVKRVIKKLPAKHQI